MGQINISKIIDNDDIIVPPNGVLGIFNDEGVLQTVNSVGEITPLSGGLRQASVEISAAEVADLENTSKVLVPAAGTGVVNVFIDGYIKVIPISGTLSVANAEIRAGGNTIVAETTAFGGSVERRFKFVDINSGVAANDDYSYITNNEITLVSSGPLTGGSASAIVYFTWTQYNENLL
jgi:UDP-N-acetylmuramate-alanine ligase